MDPDALEQLNALLDSEVALREKIKSEIVELDKKSRIVSSHLNKIHYTRPAELPSLLERVHHHLVSCRDNLGNLAAIIPQNQFWRWKDMWAHSIRTLVFSAALAEYLTSRTLITLPQTSELLGIDESWNDRLFLPTEDYLHGIISLVNELSRLAVNSVTMGNFEEPFNISVFLKGIFAGFSMLNLKNDLLRKRYDSLKYDIKKVEEVVYDVSLRKLVSVSTEDGGAPN